MNRYPHSGHGRGTRTNLPAPAWALALANDTWSALPNTDFTTWSNANMPYKGQYRGNDINGNYSTIDAFCDPANDVGAQYFYGGGHGDGTCNAVCKFDHTTLAWSLIGQPAPPSCYLPGYPTTTTADYYPSGLLFEDASAQKTNFFLTANELTNALDLPYAAPALSRVSTHMYGAAIKRGAKTHYFYLTYGEFDTAAKTWGGRGVDLGAQLNAFSTNYGTPPLQQGTMAVYDSLTDKVFLTLVPGDAGGGWRSGLIVFNPTSQLIENVYISSSADYGLVLSSANMVQVGRNLYLFLKPGVNGTPQPMNNGFIFNMDSRTMKKFTVTGTTASLDGTTYQMGDPEQDTIPSYYDGVAIRRWNYELAKRGNIHSVNPTPVSGTGTVADPYVLAQTTRAIAGTAPNGTNVSMRLVWNAAAGCAMICPRASDNWVALKLS